MVLEFTLLPSIFYITLLARLVRLNCEAMGSSVSGLTYCEDCLLTLLSAQSRQAIQVLDEARDAVQTLHIGSTTITTGSVDGHVRTYDLRKGELRSDYLGCKSPPTLASKN